MNYRKNKTESDSIHRCNTVQTVTVIASRRNHYVHSSVLLIYLPAREDNPFLESQKINLQNYSLQLPLICLNANVVFRGNKLKRCIEISIESGTRYVNIKIN